MFFGLVHTMTVCWVQFCFLCFAEERSSYKFGLTWLRKEWQIIHFGVNFPFNLNTCKKKKNMHIKHASYRLGEKNYHNVSGRFLWWGHLSWMLLSHSLIKATCCFLFAPNCKHKNIFLKNLIFFGHTVKINGVPCCLFSKIYCLFLCFAEERRLNRFGLTLKWIISFNESQLGPM